MSEKNGSLESAIQNFLTEHPKMVDSGRQWILCVEDYQEAVALIERLAPLRGWLSDDEEKRLASAQEFVKNYDKSVQMIRDSIQVQDAE